jgi:hypothetical protein
MDNSGRVKKRKDNRGETTEKYQREMNKKRRDNREKEHRRDG